MRIGKMIVVNADCGSQKVLEAVSAFFLKITQFFGIFSSLRQWFSCIIWSLGWGQTVVKAFWIGMLWNSKCRFVECHFINGSFLEILD